MYTKEDLAERFDEPVETICEWYACRVLPEPIKVGGEFRWRVEDIELWEDYLRARRDCREQGINPDSEAGPAPPIYSHGIPTVDPREIIAQERESERQTKSKTLAAGSAPVPKRKSVVIPEVADAANKHVEGKS